MTKKCTHCGAPENEWVCRRKDGSNMFALDLDLSVEYPKTWASPAPVRLTTSGVCKDCVRQRIADMKA